MKPPASCRLKNAKANGVRVDVVNPMPMEPGSSRSSWDDAVIAAAEPTLRQMAGTPARQRVTWDNNTIEPPEFWSVGWDNGGCRGGGASATRSSFSQSTFGLTNIFKGFHG